MTGVKRIRTDYNSSFTQDDQEESKRIAPADYSFNFIPTLKLSEKIFDIDFTTTHAESRPRPIAFSANTLTHRFNKRSQKFRVESRQKKQVAIVTHNSVQESSKTYEPMYLRHQDISYTIITYLQMSFNIIITATVLYIFTKMILVVKQDFRLKAQEHLEALHQEKLTCSKNYVVNHCGQEDRVPAVESMCNEWASCMQKDIVVAQAKVSAEAIAEIINSFVEPISYKTLLFFSLLILGSLLFSNLAFGIFRRKYNRPVAIANN